ncbi:MAG: RNA-directed DNA polymerase [Rickettsiales bacterium]|jgi:hypothetical protein|nr:RNA-directed DNA polymerase [Rickettsiales bacterium]
MSELWNEFISESNFNHALHRASAARQAKPAVARFLENAAANLEKVRQTVSRGEFRTSEYRTMEITDPKRRTIYILPFAPDRIIHHAVMNIMAPIWTKLFIRDTFACIPGRGLCSADIRTMTFCRKNEFALKCDIAKFYPSITHDILWRIVRKYTPCPEIAEILRDIIYSVGGGKNLPIGNLCSQWLGNLYLNELDQFVKRELKCESYLRYCDDFLLFSNDKKQLAEWREKIRAFLNDKLQLRFSKCEIMPVRCGVDFIGYRHFADFILMRKRTLKKLRKRIVRIGNMTQIPAARLDKIRGQVSAANGWLKHANTYNLRKKLRFARVKKKVGIKS